jgi:peptidyl-prolyl cis-trans isomerase A (cyclophilin A)
VRDQFVIFRPILPVSAGQRSSSGTSVRPRTRAAGRVGPWQDGRMDATLHTNKGDICITLFPDHAPKTVRNFTGLATGEQEWTDERTGQKRSDPFYDGLTFHRIIPNFMIQGGCPTGTGTGGPGYAFEDEIHPELAFNKPYLLAMANAGKRGGRGTNGSQFFITTVNTPHLQGKHTIFGEVADQASRDVVDAISAVPTGAQDRPVEPVVIESVTIA